MKHPKNIGSTGEARDVLGLAKIGHDANLAANTYWDACDKLAEAEAIMEKFVSKVDSGRARSVETYAEMAEWLKKYHAD